MIARVTKGHGFADLARNLEIGRNDANHSDRVVWTDARNLPTDDPHTASLLMRATAAQSARTEKPVYHIALSFNPEDAVDRATMVQVDRLMNDLGPSAQAVSRATKARKLPAPPRPPGSLKLARRSPNHHSNRSASVGLTDAARHAGSIAAPSATIVSRVLATVSVVPSTA